MSWSPELPIGEFRPWPDTVHVVRGRTGEMLRYVPEQAIAATLGPRTCHNEDGWCSGCRHFLHDSFEWCPWCGAKVV